MRTLTILLAAGAALTSSSAFAAKNSAEKPQAAASNAAADSAANRKYCLAQNPDDNTTGTRLFTRECKTKAQWAKEGVNVDELKKTQ